MLDEPRSCPHGPGCCPGSSSGVRGARTGRDADQRATFRSVVSVEQLGGRPFGDGTPPGPVAAGEAVPPGNNPALALVGNAPPPA